MLPPHLLTKDPKDVKILVAMSGGVDSATVAAILKYAGYQVIGVTLQLYDGNNTSSKKACCGTKDIYDARHTAMQLEIPHYVVNYESTFRQEVVERFVDDYIAGITPIPCIRCNQSVKFRDLLKISKEIGVDVMATGHYVQRIDKNDVVEMHTAIDQTKDQSYFLFATTQEQLNHLIFPLGSKKKIDVRQIAMDYGLKIHDKDDSQDICFVGNGNYIDIVKKVRAYIPEHGNIVHIETNKILGTHAGLIKYTVGQRRGLSVAHKSPLYVVKIDQTSNTLFVGEESYLYSTNIMINELNILDDNMKNNTIEGYVCVRALQERIPARITTLNETAIVELAHGGRAITKGQACVIYRDTRVLGGGIIM